MVFPKSQSIIIVYGIGMYMQNHAKKWFNNTSSTNAMAAIAIGAMLVFAAAGMKAAFADTVNSDSVETGDNSVAITLPTGGGSASTDVTYWIVANNGDGETGCNAKSSSPAIVTINSGSDVDASPGELTFTSCGTSNSQTVTLSSSKAGTYEIPVSVSDGGVGTYNTNPAKITLTVNPASGGGGGGGGTTDTTPPEITYVIHGTEGNNGWYTSDVWVEWTVTDLQSEVSSFEGCSQEPITTDTTGETLTCQATSAGGPSDTVSVTLKRDATAPEVSLVGGPAAGEYDFGDVPSAPTCDASDATSGLAGSCTVTGYGDTVGSYTVKATAEDKAGNTGGADPISYTVLAWTLKGFYQPVDMNGVLNTVKGGSTVPLKFEVFKTVAGTEITATSAIKTPVKASKVTCDSGATLDEIETLASGGTTLRYDSTGGQFIYNWQTPKQPGACYNVNIGTIDGSSFQDPAEFKLK
jgi:hypothetical protein